MIYKFIKEGIKIIDNKNFNFSQVFDSGQIFRYQTLSSGYRIAYKKSIACLISKKESDIINTNNPRDFVFFFDLDRDYSIITKELCRYDELKKAVEFSSGIRILNQDPFEIILSFILSANNNIPRIKKIVKNLCESSGEQISDMFLFPTHEALRNKSTLFFREIGAGYRAKYIVNTIDALSNGFSLDIKGMTTSEARKHLMKLSGVGRKVADCILLYAYHKTDVFPTDVWIERAYDELFRHNSLTAKEKSETLTSMYGEYSGYAQQYIFYYMKNRETKS